MAQLRNQVRLVGALVASERWRYVCALVALLVGTLLIYLIPLVPTAVLDVVFGNNPEKAAGLSTTLIDWLGGAGTVRDALWRPAILIGVFAICAGVFVHLRQRFFSSS